MFERAPGTGALGMLTVCSFSRDGWLCAAAGVRASGTYVTLPLVRLRCPKPAGRKALFFELAHDQENRVEWSKVGVGSSV